MSYSSIEEFILILHVFNSGLIQRGSMSFDHIFDAQLDNFRMLSNIH